MWIVNNALEHQQCLCAGLCTACNSELSPPRSPSSRASTTVHASDNNNSILVAPIVKPVWKSSEQGATSFAMDDWVLLRMSFDAANDLANCLEKFLTKPSLLRLVPVVRFLDVGSRSRTKDE